MSVLETIFQRLLILFCAIYFATPALAAPRKAAGESTPVTAGASEQDCAKSLLVRGSSQQVSEYAGLLESYSLFDLLNADPEQNLAVKHPRMVMNAYQRYWQLVSQMSPEPDRVLEPTYRARRINLWRVFSGGINTRDGKQKMIVDQYGAIDALVQFLKKGAAGNRGGKMLHFVGPAGTGKTEFLSVLSSLSAELSATNPDFYEYTFEWTGLDRIPHLRAFAEVMAPGGTFRSTMQRSPLVLLPSNLQKAVVDLAAPRVRELLGYNPIAFTTPDPQTAEIISAILSHYGRQQGLRSLTDAEYMDILSQHVRIVRKHVDPNAPPAIVRVQDKTVDMAQLFASQNIALAASYGNGSALSYEYNGAIARADGSGLLMDEFFRNPQGLRNLMLEVFENKVLAFGGAPPVTLDIVPMGASNDESVNNATADGGALAQLDRTEQYPMRQPLSPYAIAKTMLVMVGVDKFKMRALKDIDENTPSPMVPVDLNELFPLPDAEGNAVGPDGRYEIYYEGPRGRNILISPRTLMYMSLVVEATRMIVEEKEIKKFAQMIDFRNISEFGHIFFSTRGRLQVTLNQLDPGPEVRTRLDHLRELLKEGQSGIMARAVQDWMTHAIDIAPNNGDTVTPALADRAFQDLIRTGNLKPSKDDIRARWIGENQMVKAEFLLKMLLEDVQAILSGDRGRVDSMYDEVAADVIALANDETAKEVTAAGGETRSIDLRRLLKISEHYTEIHGQSFVYAAVRNFHSEPGRAGKQFIKLRQAIEAFLLESQMDNQDTSALYEYLAGSASVTRETRDRGRQVEAELSTYGYNKRSFMEALKLIAELRTKIELHRQQNPQ